MLCTYDGQAFWLWYSDSSKAVLSGPPLEVVFDDPVRGRVRIIELFLRSISPQRPRERRENSERPKNSNAAQKENRDRLTKQPEPVMEAVLAEIVHRVLSASGDSQRFEFHATQYINVSLVQWTADYIR